MSFRLITQVWQLNLKGTEQHVLIALADYADDDGGHCFPSQGRLAWKTGCSESTIVRAIDRLIAKKIVKVVRPATNKAPPHYQICLDMGEMKPAFCSDLSDSRDSNLTPQDDYGDSKMTPQDGLGYQVDTSGGSNLQARGSKLTPDPISNLPTNQPDNENGPFPEKETEKAKAETARIWEVCRQELCGQSRGMSDWLPGSELLPTSQTRSGKPLYRLVVVKAESVQWLRTQAAGAITSRLLSILGHRVALDIVAELPCPEGSQVTA